jgi:hypothetical protein
MAAPPLKEELSAPYPNPSNAVMRTGMGKFWDYVTGLLGATGDAAAARTALGAASASRVMGLIGNVNATTPLTQYDLSADAVTLRDADGGVLTRYSTGTLTCDLGLAGPIANGRDQAAAFTAATFVHLYFIWNGTTLATVASAAAQTTGPTLPTGYTHWAYAGTVRWDSASNIVKVFMRDADAFYQAEVSALASGNNTAETTVSLSAAIPSNALSAQIRARYANANTATSSSLFLRLVSGSNYTSVVGTQATTGITTYHDAVLQIPNVSQQVYYLNGAASASTDIVVLGYKMPNGGA